jgi:hypothetical protein
MIPGLVVAPGVRLEADEVRELYDWERQEQREQLLRAWRRRRLPVRPARAVIGPYGVMWKEVL